MKKGIFSEKDKAEKKEMRKTGESKFQYDVRKKREKSKQKNKPKMMEAAKGGMVKGYKAGGEVKMDKSPNSGMITKRGWGKSRKT